MSVSRTTTWSSRNGHVSENFYESQMLLLGCGVYRNSMQVGPDFAVRYPDGKLELVEVKTGTIRRLQSGEVVVSWPTVKSGYADSIAVVVWNADGPFSVLLDAPFDKPSRPLSELRPATNEVCPVLDEMSPQDSLSAAN